MRNLSSISLCAGLLSALTVFGVRAEYPSQLFWTLAIVQFCVICISAWAVGASAMRDGPDERRSRALAGALTVPPIALFSFLPGIGTPWQATPAENQMRYLVLFIDGLAIAVGFIVLRSALREAGEGFYSTLGFAGIVLAAPLCGAFAAIQLTFYRSMDRAVGVPRPSDLATLDDLSIVLLLFGVTLTYLATAGFAAALGRIRWVGRRASRATVLACLVAAAFVSIRVAVAVRFPREPIWGFEHWYAMPGFILAIPAVPWLVPCALGVALLRRGGAAAPTP